MSFGPPGAIERVTIEDGRPRVWTVGSEPPVGICGSGILDAIAELRRAGVVNGRGRFAASDRRIRPGRAGAEYVLVDAADSGTGEDIVITRHGRQVARLIKVSDGDTSRADEAFAKLRELRKGNRLGGLSWKELRDEGRK